MIRDKIQFFALTLIVPVLSGCFQVTVKETLKTDGTSDIKIKTDLSAILKANHDTCRDIEFGPNLTHYDIECKNISPGVSESYFKRKNTDVYTHQGSDLIYNLESIFWLLRDGVSIESEQDPVEMGGELKYQLISPWELSDNTTGTLLDSNTLEIDLFKIENQEDIQVTLKGAASSLAPNKEIPIGIKIKLFKYLKKHHEKVSKSKASIAKKEAYYDKLISRIERWAGNSRRKMRIRDYMITKIEAMKQAVSTDRMSDDDRLMAVQSMATLIKSAYATGSIKSYDTRTFNIAQTLKKEGYYDLSKITNFVDSFAFGSKGGDDFFFLSCGKDRLFVDGSGNTRLEVQSLENELKICEKPNLENLQIPGYTIILGSKF